MDTKFYGDMTNAYAATIYDKDDKFRYEIHKIRAEGEPCKVFLHTAWGFANAEDSENNASEWLKEKYKAAPRP